MSESKDFPAGALHVPTQNRHYEQFTQIHSIKCICIRFLSSCAIFSLLIMFSIFPLYAFRWIWSYTTSGKKLKISLFLLSSGWCWCEYIVFLAVKAYAVCINGPTHSKKNMNEEVREILARCITSVSIAMSFHCHNVMVLDSNAKIYQQNNSEPHSRSSWFSSWTY